MIDNNIVAFNRLYILRLRHVPHHHHEVLASVIITAIIIIAIIIIITTTTIIIITITIISNINTVLSVTSNMTVKLADLGEARFIHDNDPRKLPLNINWSSPEILIGGFDSLSTAHRTAVDIWSLAMVLTEIFTGEVPFDNPECRSISSNIDQFIEYLRGGARPKLPKDYLDHRWLHDMVRMWREYVWLWIVYVIGDGG